ncbi:putative effector protein [Ceratobasidium theobromae]|uniref:Putative effector protein n=1 Tax=Ceratobasidium theobromae TaxID=1582974 RepID=A0A5N5Q9E7_9AGAM|nr:putative effector protein [Ceratobasidium theobromae]
MQLTNLITFATTALFALSGVQAYENFSATCKKSSIALSNGRILRADCLNGPNGSYISSSLDLNKCVTNNGGKLGCQHKGQGSVVMDCQCSPGGQVASIWLDTCVYNVNGKLDC